MSELIRIITSVDPDLRNTPLETICGAASVVDLQGHCRALESFRHESTNLYERVRALLFLSAIHRYHLPPVLPVDSEGLVPYDGFTHLLQRRYEEAIQTFLAAEKAAGPSETISSALAAGYRGLAFQTLADQVRKSVRSVRGNQWMFRTGHVADYPLRIRPELTKINSGVFPVLAEATPVRMDLSHSGWSDIFFLGMDFPEGARVLNVSIDLSVRTEGSSGTPKPPVEAYLRVIDQPVLRLVSVDLHAQADITSLAEVFEFASDYLGLLKAAVVASGIIPPGFEGSSQPLANLLARLTGKHGHGIELVSKVNDIPKGSRLAVSTNLLACLISACMRATNQIETLTGPLAEDDRRMVAARAILGEWIGGSGGGWQDSGGVWPGIKLITGVPAQPNDVEYGVSRGCLLPKHRVFTGEDLAPGTRELLQNSLVLVHGGMAQDVGPILEMVTEKYLLRSQKEWIGRLEAIHLLDEILDSVRNGDIRQIATATQRNFDGPIQTIIPWSANHYTNELIRRVRAEFGEGFWGFWMLGGMSGGGMGFIFDPAVKAIAQERLRTIMKLVKREIESAVPFAIDPVVYDFAINDDGSSARLLCGTDALLPGPYYTLVVPQLLRQDARDLTPARRCELEHFGLACQHRPDLSGMASGLIEHLLPRNANEGSGEPAATLDALLAKHGFDSVQHEKIRADLRAGRIGIAQNALPSSARIEDVSRDQVQDARPGVPERFRRLGEDALRSGAVAVVSLAGGIGTRWTKGAGVVKALSPFCRLDGAYRTFAEIHIAKTRRTSRITGTPVPHIFTTSYMTQAPIEAHLRERNNYGYTGPLYLSPGKSVGLRLIPTIRDLRFAWEEMSQQVLDAQKQKVRDSMRAALMQWAQQVGEGSDYRDNLPLQCMHPVGHWYELPNLLLNGTLARVLQECSGVRYLLLHNIDTLGLTIDAGLLGLHIDSGATLTTEVISRVIDDRGGGLAHIDGRVRLIEGMAIPREELEFKLSFYNTGTMWVDIDKLLTVFGLGRTDLLDGARVAQAVRDMAARMPTYVTLKEVKKRWGKGQEDVFPVTQFEKLWGDMTALPEVQAAFVIVPRARGQQLKDVAQLDGWARDGSAAYVASLCDWS